MKAKIVYRDNGINTIIENPAYDFMEFCQRLFSQKIYLSIVEEGKGVSLAINTNNIIFVEEIKKEKK